MLRSSLDFCNTIMTDSMVPSLKRIFIDYQIVLRLARLNWCKIHAFEMNLFDNQQNSFYQLVALNEAIV